MTCKLQDSPFGGDYDRFLQEDKKYHLSAALGFENPLAAWHANPTINFSVRLVETLRWTYGENDVGQVYWHPANTHKIQIVKNKGEEHWTIYDLRDRGVRMIRQPGRDDYGWPYAEAARLHVESMLTAQRKATTK